MKTFKFFVAVIVVLFGVVTLSSCNSEDSEPQVVTELLSIDEGLSNDGGTWSMGTFCNPVLSFTRAFYVTVSEDAQTYEFYFETTSKEFLVARIFPDAETAAPLVAYFVTDKAPTNAVTDHSNFDYEVDVDTPTSAQVILDYNGQRVRTIVSVVKK